MGRPARGCAATRAAAAGVALAAAGAVAAGCGEDRPPLSPACTEGAGAILRALARAPGPVRLADGTRLSDCVTRAYGDGELQSLGFSLTPAADRLAAAPTPRSALQLGYLVGAIRRGAARTNGVHVELVRRLEGTATFDAPALVAAARRGIRAGERSG